MSEKNVLVVFVLDETGSMHDIMDKTISATNEYFNGLKPKGKICHATLVKFNSVKTEFVCQDVPVKDVPLLTRENYQPNHSTPLYDAVGSAIGSTNNAIKNSKTKPDILFVVLTDGEENDSRSHTREQIVDTIKEREKSGWTFVYLGANQDSWKVAQTMGYSSAGTVSNFKADNAGIVHGMATASAATNRYFGRREAYYQTLTSSNADLSNASFSDKDFLVSTTEDSLETGQKAFTAKLEKKEKKENAQFK